MTGRGKSAVTWAKARLPTTPSKPSAVPASYAFPSCKNFFATSAKTDSSITWRRISPRSPPPFTKPLPATSDGTSTGTSLEWPRRGAQKEHYGLKVIASAVCREHHGTLTLGNDSQGLACGFVVGAEDDRAIGRGDWGCPARIPRTLRGASGGLHIWRFVGREEIAHSQYRRIQEAGRRVPQRTWCAGVALAGRMLCRRLPLARRHRAVGAAPQASEHSLGRLH